MELFYEIDRPDRKYELLIGRVDEIERAEELVMAAVCCQMCPRKECPHGAVFEMAKHCVPEDATFFIRFSDGSEIVLGDSMQGDENWMRVEDNVLVRRGEPCLAAVERDLYKLRLRARDRQDLESVANRAAGYGEDGLDEMVPDEFMDDSDCSPAGPM